MVEGSGSLEDPRPSGTSRATKSGARRTGDVGLFVVATVWLFVSLAAVVTATALGIGTCEECGDRAPFALLFVTVVHLAAVMGIRLLIFRPGSWSLGVAKVVAICIAVPVVTLGGSYLIVNGGA